MLFICINIKLRVSFALSDFIAAECYDTYRLLLEHRH